MCLPFQHDEFPSLSPPPHNLFSSLPSRSQASALFSSSPAHFANQSPSSLSLSLDYSHLNLAFRLASVCSSHLFSFLRLRNLTLSGFPCAFTSLQPSPSCLRDLKHLNLRACEYYSFSVDDVTATLAAVTALQKLSVRYNAFDRDFDDDIMRDLQAKIPELEELDFDVEGEVETRTLHQLFADNVSRLNGLKRLTLRGYGSTAIRYVASLTHLTSLNIASVSDTCPGQFNFHHSFGRLRHLNMRMGTFPEAGNIVRAISRLPRLRSLEMDVRSGKDIKSLSVMTSLTALHMVLMRKDARIEGDQMIVPESVVKLELTNFPNGRVLERFTVAPCAVEGFRRLGIYGVDDPEGPALAFPFICHLPELCVDLRAVRDSRILLRLMSRWHLFSDMTYLRCAVPSLRAFWVVWVMHTVLHCRSCVGPKLRA